MTDDFNDDFTNISLWRVDAAAMLVACLRAFVPQASYFCAHHSIDVLEYVYVVYK